MSQHIIQFEHLPYLLQCSRWLVWMLAEGNKGHKLLEVQGPTHLQDVLVDISRSCKVSPVARWANELHLGVNESDVINLGGGFNPNRKYISQNRGENTIFLQPPPSNLFLSFGVFRRLRFYSNWVLWLDVLKRTILHDAHGHGVSWRKVPYHFFLPWLLYENAQPKKPCPIRDRVALPSDLLRMQRIVRDEVAGGKGC